jgi:hypothetical protein
MIIAWKTMSANYDKQVVINAYNPAIVITAVQSNELRNHLRTTTVTSIMAIPSPKLGTIL